MEFGDVHVRLDIYNATLVKTQCRLHVWEHLHMEWTFSEKAIEIAKLFNDQLQLMYNSFVQMFMK